MKTLRTMPVAHAASPLLVFCGLLLLCTAAATHAEPVNVRTIPLADVLKTRILSAPATVVARNTPRLAAEVDARIAAMDADVGVAVTAGQVLARLDCRAYEARLGAAQAAVDAAATRREFARQQLERARNLQKNKSISEELLDQRANELDVAVADLQAAQQQARLAAIDVENCVITAPVDAVVSERSASIGSYVSRGNVLFGLVETVGQEVSVDLRHEQAASVQRADMLLFESNGRRYRVTLRALLPVADPVARTRVARLTFDDAAALVGSAGRLIWRGSDTLVPADYLVRRDEAIGVFVLDGDRARFVALSNAQDGRPAEVALAPDTLLITDGRQALVDGSAVRVTAGGAAP